MGADNFGGDVNAGGRLFLSATQSAQAQLKSGRTLMSRFPLPEPSARRSDNNGRFVLSNLSAFCHAQWWGGGTIFSFADRRA
jgi:hypothetical protein